MVPEVPVESTAHLKPHMARRDTIAEGDKRVALRAGTTGETWSSLQHKDTTNPIHTRASPWAVSD